MGEISEITCPFPNTHDKFDEAHYFLSTAIENYHEPQPFRWNLNAFLQALRSVTLVMQKELAHVKGGTKWYEKQRQIISKDSLLTAFRDGRNFVAKQGMLEASSSIGAGIFRGRILKLTFNIDVDPSIPSRSLLEHAQKTFLGVLMDAEHSAISEQIGVHRRWIFKELGEDEVISLCDKAWSRIGLVFRDAHKEYGFEFEGPSRHGHAKGLAERSVLLESDLDPSLPRMWGWVEDESKDRH